MRPEQKKTDEKPFAIIRMIIDEEGEMSLQAAQAYGLMLDKITVSEILKGVETVHVQLHDQWWEFQIWPADQLEDWNKGYEVEDYIPNHFAIGSDGGLEMLTIDFTTGVVYAIPFIPMKKEERIKVADSLEIMLDGAA